MTPENGTTLKQTGAHKLEAAVEPRLLLRADRQLFRPSDVPVPQVELGVEVLVGRDGRGVVRCGAFRGEVLPGQNAGDSETPSEACQRRPRALGL